MANKEQLEILLQGAKVWNKWRSENPNESIDLRMADLRAVNLTGAHLTGADLGKADLRGAWLGYADLLQVCLRGASLMGADLFGVHLREADLKGACIVHANLSDACLNWADLRMADLSWANLSRATLVETNLEGSNLTGCKIYGISAWKLRLKGAKQSDLVITPDDEPDITVDKLEVAQFIYLLLHNEKIRDVIETITSKIVLILGRFSDTRKPVLDAIKNELRQRDYLPVLFRLREASKSRSNRDHFNADPYGKICYS